MELRCQHARNHVHEHMLVITKVALYQVLLLYLKPFSVTHTCHKEETCPPCTVLTEKECVGGHKVLKLCF